MITILKETPKNPLQLIGSMTGVCWHSDITDSEKNKKRALDCISSDHGRVLEYVDIYMCIEGYSARVIREWYTHIGGSPTRLQESTRYVDCEHFSFVIPPYLRSEDMIANQKEITFEYDRIMNEISASYKKLTELGMPREDVAGILPLNMTTKIVDKRNLRNLADMSRKRMCKRALWEYQELFHEIIEALNNYSDEWKCITELLFKPQCKILGRCPEKNGCSKK